MAEDITSWIAKALIDQDAISGDYQVERTGLLVQLVKFETFRTDSLPHRQITAFAHDRTHSVKLAFDVGATDQFEASQYGVEGERLTSHLRHVFHLKRFSFDLAPPLPNRRSIVLRSNRKLPEVILQVREWDVLGGSKEDPVFHDRVHELGYGPQDVVLQRVLIKLWYGDKRIRNHRSKTPLAILLLQYVQRVLRKHFSLVQAEEQPLYSNGQQRVSDFLQPYLFPPASKRSKPIPDWLFVVSQADRAALDEIKVFGGNVGAETATVADAAADGALDIGLEYGSPMASPGSASFGPGTMYGQEEGDIDTRQSDDGQDDEGAIEWTSTPNVRRAGAAQQATSSQTDSDKDVEFDESIDVLIPPRPPTASLGALPSTAAEESLHLYPRQNISRSATPAVLKGVTTTQRQMQTRNDGQDTFDVGASQMSSTSTALSAPASSGQSMVVKPARESLPSRARRTAESLEMMQRHVQSPSTQSSAGRDSGMSRASSRSGRHLDEDMGIRGGVDIVDVDGFEVVSATMPFPPAGQKRGSSLLVKSPAGDRPSRSSGRSSQNQASPSQVRVLSHTASIPISPVEIQELHDDEDVGLEVDVQLRPIAHAVGIPQSEIGTPARQSQQGTLESRSEARSSIAEAAATRNMPTASQQSRHSIRNSHPTPGSLIASSPIKAETSFDLNASPVLTVDQDPHSLESNKTATSLPPSGSASSPSKVHARAGGHTSTSTATTASSSRVTEGQRPIPSRGGQTSWIHMSPMTSLYDVNGQGKGKGLVREPTASLSQSQSQEGDMSLSRYATTTRTGAGRGNLERREQSQPSMPPLRSEYHLGTADLSRDDDEGPRDGPLMPGSNGASQPDSGEERRYKRAGIEETRMSASPQPTKARGHPTLQLDHLNPGPHAGAGSSDVSLRRSEKADGTDQAVHIEPPPRMSIDEKAMASASSEQAQHQNDVAGPRRLEALTSSAQPGTVKRAQPLQYDRHPAMRPVKRPKGMTRVHKPTVQSPEDRKPRLSELDARPLIQSHQARVNSRSGIGVKIETPDQSRRKRESGQTADVKMERVSPLPAAAARQSLSRRSSKPKQRPPLLDGFQPDLRVQMGVDMTWLLGEMQEVADLRKDQGLL